jgi:hypothetical protein
MGFLAKLLGRSAPAASPTSTPQYAPPAPTRPRLVYGEHLADFDEGLATLLREQTAAHLERIRASHLDIFRPKLAERDGELSPDDLDAELQALVSSLEECKGHVVATIHDMVTKARKDWDGDVLGVFFGTYSNATNYDAVIVEEVLRVTTATFEDALALACEALPTLSEDDGSALRKKWDFARLSLQREWTEMHQDRFNAVYASWGSHQHPDSLLKAFKELCRAHFETEARNSVRIYRHTLLPMVTSGFAKSDMNVSSLDPETVETIRSAAFEGFPVADAWERFPAPSQAYLFAWYDVWRISDDTKERAIAKGRERYASEIRAVDCDDQFARLGEVIIDGVLEPLFAEVQEFYVTRMTSSRASY